MKSHNFVKTSSKEVESLRKKVSPTHRSFSKMKCTRCGCYKHSDERVWWGHLANNGNFIKIPKDCDVVLCLTVFGE